MNMAKFTAHDQQSLVSILLRYWEEIVAIEEEFKLLVGKGDSRPRIDFFHDAIRAYTSGHHKQRLVVENLAYDVKCLRYLADMPMASITHDTGNFSPGTALVVSAPGLVEVGKKMDRETKARLKELYEQYGVLFASLLKITAENDYVERTESLNEEVEQINRLIHAITSGATTEVITNHIHHLTDESLKRDLVLLIPQMKGKSAGALAGLIARLKANIQKNDKRIKGIDGAYHQYATSQLALYENSKEMLKKMAGQGMNLVGAFVESALKGGGQQQRGR